MIAYFIIVVTIALVIMLPAIIFAFIAENTFIGHNLMTKLLKALNLPLF